MKNPAPVLKPQCGPFSCVPSAACGDTPLITGSGDSFCDKCNEFGVDEGKKGEVFIVCGHPKCKWRKINNGDPYQNVPIPDWCPKMSKDGKEDPIHG